MEKWVIPSCLPCNVEYGKIERLLLQKLGMGVDPWVPGGEGIGERALRSFDPREAKGPRDLKHREGARDRMARELKTVKEIPEDATTFPNIGRIHEPSDDGYMTMDIGQYMYEWGKIMAKFMRGITFREYGVVIGDEYIVTTFMPSEHDKLPAGFFAGPSKRFDRGVGFIVERFQVPEDQLSALFRVFLWSKYEIIGVVNKKIVTEEEKARSEISSLAVRPS